MHKTVAIGPQPVVNQEEEGFGRDNAQSSFNK